MSAWYQTKLMDYEKPKLLRSQRCITNQHCTNKVKISKNGSQILWTWGTLIMLRLNMAAFFPFTSQALAHLFSLYNVSKDRQVTHRITQWWQRDNSIKNWTFNTLQSGESRDLQCHISRWPQVSLFSWWCVASSGKWSIFVQRDDQYCKYKLSELQSSSGNIDIRQPDPAKTYREDLD